MWNILQSLVISAVSIFVYSNWLHEDVMPQQIAVVNYDSAVAKLGDSPSAQQVSDVMSDLQQKASRLSAAGFVVIDSRVLVSYPQINEVPGLETKPAPQKKDPKGPDKIEATPVKPGAFDEK